MVLGESLGEFEGEVNSARRERRGREDKLTGATKTTLR